MRRNAEFTIGGDVNGKSSRQRGKPNNRDRRDTPDNEGGGIRVAIQESQVENTQPIGEVVSPNDELLPTPVAEEVQEIQHSTSETGVEIDIDDLTFPKIPESILKDIVSLSEKTKYLNTPKFLLRALEAIGISYTIIEKGHSEEGNNSEVRGDMFALTMNVEGDEFDMGKMTTQQVVEFIKGVAKKQVHTERVKVIEASLASENVQPNITQGESVKVEETPRNIFSDIPEASLNSIELFLKKNEYVNTPAGVLKVLRDAGFTIKKTRKGTPQQPGDTLQFSKEGISGVTMSTSELMQTLQRTSRERKKMSRSKAPITSKTSKTPEDTDTPSVQPSTQIVPIDGGVIVEPRTKIESVPSYTVAEEVTGDDLRRRIPSEDIVDANIISESVHSRRYYTNSTSGGEEEPLPKESTDEELSVAEGLRAHARETSELRAQILNEEEVSSSPIEVEDDMQKAQDIPVSSFDTSKQEHAYNHNLSHEYVIDPVLEVNGRRVNSEEYGTFYLNSKREHTPAQTMTKEVTPDVPKKSENEKHETRTQSPREKFFDTRFSTEFGITKEAWKTIEGHDTLSLAQQKLVLENLRELSNRDTPFMKGIWEGIKAKLGRGGESEDHLTTLTQLVRGVVLYGPKVHEDEETGELFPDFVDINKPPRSERKEYKTAIDALNRHAHVLAKTPASWLEDGIGTHSERESRAMSFIKEHLSPARKKYNEYQRILNSYEASKKALAQVLGGSGYSPSEIAQKLVEIDGKVYGLQFQQTSPEAVEEIKRIPDTGMWKEVMKSLCSTSNIGYMGLGYVGRTALAGALGIFAAPAVSATIAGGRSWNRTAAELRERDRGARSGVRDTSQEALNIVSAEMTMNIGGEKREVGVTQKLQKLLDKYQALNAKEDSMTPQNFEKEKNTILNHMRARVSYVEDKQRLNRISYGNKEEHAVQMTKLYETLAFAKIILADQYNVEEKSELERRLHMVLFFREQRIQKRRRTLQTKKVAWNALRAGAFAYAGGELAEKVREWDPGTKLDSLVKDYNVDRVQVEGGLKLDQVSATDTSDTSTPSVAESVSKTPEIPETPPYTIKSGDTLSGILKEQIPEIKNLGGGKAQENAIANILRGLSSEELKEIGIKSGDVNLIRPGDTINLDMLEDSIKSQQGVIDSAIARFGDTESQIQRGGEMLKSDAFIPNQYGEGPYDSTSDISDSLQPEVISGTQQEVPKTGYEGYVSTEAKMLDAHFQKEIFGNDWNRVKGMTVDEFSTKTPVLRFGGAPTESTRVMKELMATVAKQPMNVSPVRGETMQTYLGRAYTAFAKHENVIPQGNTIRKILREARMSKLAE
jgi:hypothetical protein